MDNPGLIRVAIDRTVSPFNGAVFFFSKGMRTAALNRLAWGPDGALYIGTIATATGNWPGGDKQPFYRLAPKPLPTGAAPAFEMKAIRSLADGLELEFTAPVDPATAGKEKFKVLQWQYVREEVYGVGKRPEQSLTVSATEISPDGLRVHVRIAGLVRDRVVHLKHAGLLSSGGKTPWNDEAWFTHNTVSTHAWNPVTAMERERAPRDPGFRVVSRMGREGMEVELKAASGWRAELIDPAGRMADASAGFGTTRMTLGYRGLRGLYILRITSTEGGGPAKAWARTVMFP